MGNTISPYKIVSQYPYKYWLIYQLSLIEDIKYLIAHNPAWYVRVFKLPYPHQFSEHGHYLNDDEDEHRYMNNEGIVFKQKLSRQNVKHNYAHDIAILNINNKVINNVDFYYSNKRKYYYTIDYKSSYIRQLMIADPSTIQYNCYISIIDPTFIVI